VIAFGSQAAIGMGFQRDTIIMRPQDIDADGAANVPPNVVLYGGLAQPLKVRGAGGPSAPTQG